MSHILKFLGQASHQNSSLFISISDNPPTTSGLSGHVYLPYLWSGGNGMNSTPKGVTLPTEAAVIFLYATWVTFIFWSVTCGSWKLTLCLQDSFLQLNRKSLFLEYSQTKSSSCWDIFKRHCHLWLKSDINEVKLLSDKSLIDSFSYSLKLQARWHVIPFVILHWYR